MNFETFWKLIQNSRETELFTLSQKKPFSFRFDNSHNAVEIIPNTKSNRSTQKIQFQVIWDMAKKSTTPFLPGQYGKITYNSSYLVAIMKYFLKNEKIE
jgi:hypothetical protein